MIRIYKNNDNKYVTKGAYESFYKPLGYKIVIDETKENKVQLDNQEITSKRTRSSSNKKVKEEE